MRPTILAALLLATPISAAELSIHFDPAATEVSFQLPATGHDVHGVFHLQRGQLRIDPETGRASGEIVVDARDAETGNSSRDKTMHRKVLESSLFPSFVFVPERMEGALSLEGESDVTLVGTLSIHGAEHPLSLAVHVRFDGQHLSADTSFPVPYVEWGLHDPSVLFLRVAPVVEVSVAAEADLQPATVASR